MKLLLIYNPASGGGRAKNLLSPILDDFNHQKVEVVLHQTTRQGDAIQFLKQQDLSPYQGVIAAGGDGTIFEVLNGYMQNKDPHKPPFGLLPNGTGNAFSKELGITGGDWKKAINIILTGNTKKIDVGKFCSQKKSYYFLNMLGLGFVSDVNASSCRLKFLGNFAYILAVFHRLIGLKSYKLQLTLDNDTLERDNVFVEIANSRYTGTTYLMAPDAKVDDGLLDVVLLNKVSRLKILKLFPTIFNGEHIKYPEVEIFKAKKISLTTTPKQILTPDGELFGTTPIEIECLPKLLEVFWP